MGSYAARYLPNVLDKSSKSHEAAPEPLRSQSDIESPQASQLGGVGGKATDLSSDDETLIASICLGNNDALAPLFRRYASLVRATALQVLRDAAEADDLLQDIFLLIHRLCRTFDPAKAPARFWILQMTYRRAISRRRYLNSRHFYTRVEFEELSGEATSPPSPRSEDPADQIVAGLDLQKLFGSLSEDQQKTLRLHFVEGYTLEEIAKILGQTVGNVRHHSFRGLERLRKQIFCGKSSDTGAV
jgi:RNA polymerase sigma-70 factor (ECF subfamily)